MTRSVPDQSLGPAWAILELLARGIVDDSEREMVRNLLLSETLDWGELLEQALRHKMLPMLAHHVISVGPAKPAQGGDIVYMQLHLDVFPAGTEPTLAAAKVVAEATR